MPSSCEIANCTMLFIANSIPQRLLWPLAPFPPNATKSQRRRLWDLLFLMQNNLAAYKFDSKAFKQPVTLAVYVVMCPDIKKQNDSVGKKKKFDPVFLSDRKRPRVFLLAMKSMRF